jgi:hypothetical protein
MPTLAHDAPLKVSYCIPLWLRDSQVASAIARRLPTVTGQELKDEPIALVSFGPSLNETWPKVSDFQYRMTCSGSHKFLLERGIVPTWHVEVDPRPHKIDLLGPPHPDVTYLVATTCHPRYYDHLLNAGATVKVWHVFDASPDGLRTMPPGEWAVTGGCSVGLRTLTMARFFGFTDLHIFGMDGCEGPTGKHAAPHPMQAKDASVTTYKGVEYRTTPAFLEGARGTFHELNQMPDVHATFYGTGLVQAMAEDFVPSGKTSGQVLAFAKPELISATYRDLNSQLHQVNPAYGVGGERHAPTVLKLAEAMKTKNILDYGCGKGRLATAIPWAIAEYDPAIPGKTELPKPADLVVCTDVLEHIEPDKLVFVLDDLRRCVRLVGYFTIDTRPSQKTLADGRNTHLILRNETWWRKQLGKFFQVGMMRMQHGRELHVVVGPKAKAA